MSDPIDYEALVRGAWDVAFSIWKEDPDGSVNLKLIHRNGATFTEDTEPEAWAAAWAYTEARLEEIRQLQREIEFMRAYGEQYTREDFERILSDHDANGYECEEENFDGWLKRLPGYVRDNCAIERIVMRLQSALAELQKGLKP